MNQVSRPSSVDCLGKHEQLFQQVDHIIGGEDPNVVVATESLAIKELLCDLTTLNEPGGNMSESNVLLEHEAMGGCLSVESLSGVGIVPLDGLVVESEHCLPSSNAVMAAGGVSVDGSSWSAGSRSSNMNSISSETLSRITWGSMKTTLGRMSRK